MHSKLTKFFAIIGVLLFVGACSAPQNENKETPLIVTTTGIIADCIQEIVGESAEVISIMGPGVDPHLYKASQGDLEKLSKADMIIFNGLHLEGKMGQVLEKMGRNKPVFAVGEHVEEQYLRPVGDGSELHDPHIWFDPDLWLHGLQGVVGQMGQTEQFEASSLDSSFQAYMDQVMEVKTALRQQLDQGLDSGQRVLITSHDAFSYFGNHFGFEVRGLQGISTAAEYGIKDVKDLVDFVIERDIRAVFVETSVSDKNLRSVVEAAAAQGHELKIGGSLYSDALGEADGPAGTYIGMLETNVQTMINGLAHE